jgi:hypothetical protein
VIQVPILGLRLLARAGIVVVAAAVATSLVKKYRLHEKVGEAIVKLGETIKDAEKVSRKSDATSKTETRSHTQGTTAKATRKRKPAGTRKRATGPAPA